MESDFLNILESRVLQIEKYFLGQERESIDLFLSGGSASSLMLHAFSILQKRKIIKMPIQAIYIQFDNFIWLEREAARSLSESLQIPLKEIAISESSLVSSEIWNSTPVSERDVLLWQFINKQIDTLAVVSGWPQYNRVDQELSVPGVEVFPQLALSENRICFFITEMWPIFLKHEKSKLFFELWSQIPFPSMRYWQDYVFKQIFPEFHPCLEWKLKNIL